MNNSILTDLLKEYELVKINNTHDLENRKSELYSSNPKLQEIDDKISKLSIDTAKLILKNNSSNDLNNLINEINNLKDEKDKILASLNLPLDYLSPKFNCSICKDTGYVFENRKNYYV